MPPNRRRVVITTSGEHLRRAMPRQSRRTGPREAVMAVAVIVAATLATLLALLITSRPYNPMNSTADPQQSVPQGPLALQSTPKPSPSPTSTLASPAPSPEPTAESAPAPPDDASIQKEIERAMRSDATLAELDVSTIVEGGRVTVVGSVKSPELKQRVDRAIRSIKGVTTIDNQLVVIEE